MRHFLLLCLFACVVLISAQKAVEENVDPIEGETKAHSAKKYTKNHQNHHHAHKHKKHTPKEQVKPKHVPVEVPEPEIELQENVETSKHAVDDRRKKEQMKDLHLQDLAYEEELNKEKSKKKAHRRVVDTEETMSEREGKLFADQETKEEKVIEDSFTPLKENKKNKNGKGKDKNNNKKDHKHKDKQNKDKSGKSKNGKGKNKDGKHKNKKW